MPIQFAPIAILPAALLVFLAPPQVAHAQLVLKLAPSAQVAPGTFAFSGTLSNPTTGDLALYSDGYKFDNLAAGLSLDDSPFNTNAPTDLPAGQSYTGLLFNVSVDPTVAPGTYGGTFSVTDGNPLDKPASDTFSVTVPPSTPAVPEASTTVSLGLLLALGLGGIAVTRRRKPAFDLAA